MHVCFLNPSTEYYSPVSGGAVATVTMQYARQFRARGHQVTVLTRMDKNEVYAVGDVEPVTVRERHELAVPVRAVSKLRRKLCHWDMPFYEWYWASVKRAVRRLSPAPDVVILHNDLVSPRYLRRLLPKAKILLWMHNETRTHRKGVPALRESVDKIICVSRYVRDWMRRTYDLPEDKLAVVTNGVDPDVFHPRPDYLEAGGPVKALYIGRIDPNKGPDIGAAAVAALRQEGRQVSLTVAGGLWFNSTVDPMHDPFFRKLKDLMDQAGAAYLGHVTRPKVPPLVRDHDVVFVLSRSQDPNPLVCLEAMASGCVVIGSDRGGIPDACGEAGLLMDPDNPARVADALRSLVGEPAALRDRKAAAVQHAKASTWSHRFEQVEALLRT